jgi:autotransporter-associated beta strand protein
LQYNPTQLDLVSLTRAGSGSWAIASNWIPNQVPNGAGLTATFNAPTTVPVTITLDGPQTVGTLVLANSGNPATGYILSAGSAGTLTLAGTGGAAGQVLVSSGSHLISAPVTLALGGGSVSITGGGSLGISGNIGDNSTGQSLTLAGDGTGTLVLSGTNSFSGGTTVTDGTLIVANNQALLDGSSLTVGNASLFAGAMAAGDTQPLAVPQGAAPVPEPSTLVLFAVAGIVAAAAVWRRRRS